MKNKKNIILETDVKYFENTNFCFLRLKLNDWNKNYDDLVIKSY